MEIKIESSKHICCDCYGSNKTVFARTLNSDYSVGDKIYISFPLCINFFGSVCSPFSYIYIYVYTYGNHYITSCTSRYDYRRVACSILWAQHPVSLGAVYIFSNTGHMRTHLHIFNAKRPIRADQSWAELNWAEQRKATSSRCFSALLWQLVLLLLLF